MIGDTVESYWQRYRERAVWPDAPDYVVRALRRAFFMGGYMVTHLGAAQLSKGDEMTAEDEATIERVRQEFERFFADVKEGRA